jgi:hypothetical protein
MTSGDSTRCPFPLALGLFALISVGGAVALGLTRAVPPVGIFGFQIVVIGAVAVWLESCRARGSDCPWLNVGASRRLIMYGALWLVGLVSLFPIAMAPLAPFVAFGSLAALVFVPGIALVRQHIIVDHGPFEEAGVPWWLFASARLPLYFLGLLGVLLVICAVLAVLPWTMAS